VTRAGAIVLLAALACAGPRQALGPRPRKIALLPPENRSGVVAPMNEVRAAIGAALRAQGVPVVDDAAMDQFVANHRVRNTAGIDRATAAAAAEELGADAVLVSVLDLYQPARPAKFGLALRLVSTAEGAILWIDGEARTSDESPGLLDLGVLDLKGLQARIYRDLAASLAAWRNGEGSRAPACDGGRRFRPDSRFRAKSLDLSAPKTVAVLPFLNESQRRAAGELVALQLARQLEASGRFRVVEPGEMRDELRRYRIVMENGVSLDVARVLLELVHADLVVGGTVYDYQDAEDAPMVDFSAVVLQRQGEEIVWQSTSHARGDDGVFILDAGRVGTASALSCRMARALVDDLLRR